MAQRSFLRQTSFAAGELAPTLWGRSDIDKYHLGAKRLRNFFVSRQGAAYSRPGTVYCGSVKTPSDGAVRLIPFVYSDSLAFVLEFGNLYVRFWNLGGPVMNAGVHVEIATPYTTADLPRLKFAQQGAVLTLTHPSYPPYELTFGGGGPPYTAWTFAPISFDRPAGTTAAYVNRFNVIPANPNTITIDQTSGANAEPLREWGWAVTKVLLNSKGQAYETAPFVVQNMGLQWYLPWSSLIEYTAGVHGVGTQVTSGGTTWRCIASGNQGNAPPTLPTTSNTWWTQDTLAQSPRPVQYNAVPASTLLGDGGSALGSGNGVVCMPDRPVQVVIGDLYGLISTDPNFVTYRIYRGQGGTFGWVGDTKSATFTDIGNTPDYTRQPPQGTNPFKFYNAAGTLTSTEYPAACTFFEGRRFFAGTTNRPDWLWGSVANDFANFDSPYVPTAASALTFAIASRKLEQIRFLVGVGPKLLLGTQSAVWAASGTQGAPIAYNNVDVKKQVEVGASWVDPLVIDGTALFIRTKGTGVRSLAYDYMRGAFVGSDLSLLAQHLVVGYSLTDWCYAEDPWSIVYAVRSDGTLLCLTYIKDEAEIAWAWFDTPGGGGKFESVCSVPEGSEDAVYVVVNRTVNGALVRNVERFSTRVITSATINQAVCLDCAGIYSGAATQTITGLTWLVGQTVYALADGNVDGPFTVSNTGTITLTNAASYVVVGLPYTPQLQQLDPGTPAAETKTLNKVVNRVGVEVDLSRGLSVGPDFAHLVEWPQRQVSDSYGTIALASTITNQWVSGAWGIDKGGVCIQQNNPLPVTVFGITRELVFGDA